MSEDPQTKGTCAAIHKSIDSSLDEIKQESREFRREIRGAVYKMFGIFIIASVVQIWVINPAYQRMTIIQPAYGSQVNK